METVLKRCVSGEPSKWNRVGKVDKVGARGRVSPEPHSLDPDWAELAGTLDLIYHEGTIHQGRCRPSDTIAKTSTRTSHWGTIQVDPGGRHGGAGPHWNLAALRSKSARHQIDY